MLMWLCVFTCMSVCVCFEAGWHSCSFVVKLRPPHQPTHTHSHTRNIPFPHQVEQTATGGPAAPSDAKLFPLKSSVGEPTSILVHGELISALVAARGTYTLQNQVIAPEAVSGDDAVVAFEIPLDEVVSIASDLQKNKSSLGSSESNKSLAAALQATVDDLVAGGHQPSGTAVLRDTLANLKTFIGVVAGLGTVESTSAAHRFAIFAGTNASTGTNQAEADRLKSFMTYKWELETARKLAAEGYYATGSSQAYCYQCSSIVYNYSTAVNHTTSCAYRTAKPKTDVPLSVTLSASPATPSPERIVAAGPVLEDVFFTVSGDGTVIFWSCFLGTKEVARFASREWHSQDGNIAPLFGATGTAAAVGGGAAAATNEDDELQAAIAASLATQQAEDDQMARALELSMAQQMMGETEEEMLARVMAMSMADAGGSGDTGGDAEDTGPTEPLREFTIGTATCKTATCIRLDLTKSVYVAPKATATTDSNDGDTSSSSSKKPKPPPVIVDTKNFESDSEDDMLGGFNLFDETPDEVEDALNSNTCIGLFVALEVSEQPLTFTHKP